MQLIISGNTANELKVNLAHAYAEFYGVNIDSAQMNLKLPKTTNLDDNGTATTVKTSKKKTSTPKTDRVEAVQTATTEEDASEEVETTVEESSVSALAKGNTAKTSAVAFTKEDFIQALSKVNSKVGIDAARALLTKFGAKKSSDVQKEQYGEFIDACNEIIG